MIALVVVAVLIAVSGAYYYAHNLAPAADHPFQCSDPDSISSDVYYPYRLDVIESCVKASGVCRERDQGGRRRLPPEISPRPSIRNLTNSANDDYQYGDLVVEIICAVPITQQDAVSACQAYTNNITLPSVNQQIIVTGPYVLDTDHYNWAEIYPVYTLTIP